LNVFDAFIAFDPTQRIAHHHIVFNREVLGHGASIEGCAAGVCLRSRLSLHGYVRVRQLPRSLSNRDELPSNVQTIAALGDEPDEDREDAASGSATRAR
jgi:hypothetical protein